MLELLRVRAFAIIDELEAHFAPGFNVLTGETGAGKSILVDALHLVLGGRAQVEAVRTGADEAEVQALFRPRDPAATDARLSGLGLPAAGAELVVRRTAQREGRSRAWVDGAGWDDGQKIYWFSLLTLFFQAIVTALFLLLLRRWSGELLPWWWDIYKVLPLVVGAFWLFVMGLIDRLLD